MSYPSAVWDGDSPNRDRSLAQVKSPNAEDWNKISAEVIAIETALIDGLTLNSSGRAIDIPTGVIRLGVQDTGVPLSTEYPFALEIHNETPADISGGSAGASAGIYSRYEVSADQTTNCSHISVFGKLRVKADLGDGAHAGIFGYVEISGVGTVIGGVATTVTAAGHFAIEADTNFELSTGFLVGVNVNSSVNAGATLTGDFYGIRINKAAGAKSWDVGLHIDDACAGIGINIGSCTSALGFPVAGTAPVVATATGAGVAAEGSISILVNGVEKFLQYFAASS